MNKKAQTKSILFVIGVGFILAGTVGAELIGLGDLFGKILVGIGIVLAGIGAVMYKLGGA